MILAATGVCARESHTDGRARIARQVEQYVSLFALDQQDALRFGDIYKSYCKDMHAIRNRYPTSQPSAPRTRHACVLSGVGAPPLPHRSSSLPVSTASAGGSHPQSRPLRATHRSIHPATTDCTAPPTTATTGHASPKPTSSWNSTNKKKRPSGRFFLRMSKKSSKFAADLCADARNGEK